MRPPSAAAIRRKLRQAASPHIAAHSQRFFKTGPGEYGAGDRFIGVRLPVLRRIARENRALSQRSTLSLLKSAVHEERLLALLILVQQYQQGDASEQKRVFELYGAHLQHVNNWDLVDCSAHLIVGPHLRERSRRPLYRLAKSRVLWERRIAILSTLAYIRESQFDETLAIAEILLHDPEDLIHKATGWMLREVGNRDRKAEESFLQKHYHQMPRTMLRYAIEKFPETKRKRYLQGQV